MDALKYFIIFCTLATILNPVHVECEIHPTALELPKMTRFFQLFSRFPLVCFTLITIAHLQNSHIWCTANTVNPVCDTVECKQLGDLYKNNLNSFGSACVNFYDYVCHGWGQQFPRPKDQVRWDVGQMMQLEVYKEVKNLLEDNKVSNVADFEQAKAVYKACMSRPQLDNPTMELLKETINSVAVWPMMYSSNKESLSNVLCWVVDQLYIKLTGESALFNFNIVGNDFNPKELSTELRALKSPYGKIERNSPWNAHSELPNYIEFVKRIIMKVAPPNYKIHNETFYSDIKDIINFREALRKIIERNKSEEGIRVPLKMFQTIYAKRAKSNPNAQFDWLLVLRAIHKTPEDPDGLKINEKTTLYVQEDYFVKLAELLAATSRKVIVNHIHLYFLERHIEIDSSLRILLKDSLTVGAKSTGRIRDESERWQKCISSNNMVGALRQMYQKAKLTSEKKKAMSDLIDEAKRILKEQIDESSWLDAVAKNTAKYKVEKVSKKIGFAGCQIEYGSTVAVLGHELYHGFDKKGILFDAFGIYSPWANGKQEHFHHRSQCFFNHFLEFKKTYFKKLDMCSKYAHATDTLNEDMSDAMGLKLAYKGYRQKLRETNGTCLVLPHLEGYSCDQLFFMAYGNTMCAALPTTTQESQLLCDEHNLPQMRVNGAVANMKEFSDAFQCNSGDPMNVPKRCDTWK